MILRRPKVEQRARILRSTEIADRQNQRKRLFLGVFYLVVMISVVGGLVYGLNQFTVRKVVCTIESQPCDSTTNQLTQSLIGKNMFSSMSLVHSYLKPQISRQFPSTIMASFKRPTALLTLFPETSGSPLTLTNDGTIIPDAGAGSTVPITDATLTDLVIGSHVSSAKLDFYHSLASFLQNSHGLPVSRIVIQNEDEVHFFLDQNSQALLTETGLKAQLVSLQLLLNSPTIERQGKTIDLRFDNPVIK